MSKKYHNPIPTVDAIIEYHGGVVLIRRRNPPHGWALPGGFVDYGETVEQAIIREAMEETGLELQELSQFHVYSEPERDPRHHTLSVVFTAVGKGKLKGGDDATEARVFFLDDLPPKIAFDHEKIIGDYKRSVK